MQNTVAQELAWERWYKCKDFPTVTLKEIRTDGQIWVWTHYGTDYAAYQECIKKAAQEQGGRVGIVAAPAVVGTAPLVAALSPPPAQPTALSAPVWKAGSEWAYRWESPQGRGTFVWSVDGEEIYDGIPVYVVRSGQRRILYRRSDLALYVDENEGRIETRFVPPFAEYSWPLGLA
jgi:hypothetical protein